MRFTLFDQVVHLYLGAQLMLTISWLLEAELEALTLAEVVVEQEVLEQELRLR